MHRRHKLVKLAPKALENRRLLNADFFFAGNELTLNNFDSLDQLSVAQNSGNPNIFEFTLSDGLWTGMDEVGITGDGLATLSLDSSLVALNDLLIFGGNDSFDIEFGDFSLGGDLVVDNGVGPQLGFISQQATTSIQFDAVSIAGVDSICFTNSGNDFTNFTATSALNVEVVDSNDLELGSISATNQSWFQAGALDGVLGDGTDGTLTISDNIFTAELLLQASEGIDQSGGFIDADHLFLGGDESIEGGGLFNLSSANDVQLLSANINDDLQLNSVSSLTLMDGSYDSFCDDPGTNLDTEVFADFTIGGNLTLSVTGDLDQFGASVMVAGDSDLSADNVVLNESSNDFVGTVGLATTGSATIVDANEFVLNTSTIGSDLDVTVVTGNLSDVGAAAVAGMSTFNAISGTIAVDQLDATGSISLMAFGNANVVNTGSVNLITIQRRR